jgi:hypothetical protein
MDRRGEARQGGIWQEGNGRVRRGLVLSGAAGQARRGQACSGGAWFGQVRLGLAGVDWRARRCEFWNGRAGEERWG